MDIRSNLENAFECLKEKYEELSKENCTLLVSLECKEKVIEQLTENYNQVLEKFKKIEEILS